MYITDEGQDENDTETSREGEQSEKQWVTYSPQASPAGGDTKAVPRTHCTNAVNVDCASLKGEAGETLMCREEDCVDSESSGVNENQPLDEEAGEVKSEKEQESSADDVKKENLPETRHGEMEAAAMDVKRAPIGVEMNFDIETETDNDDGYDFQDKLSKNEAIFTRPTSSNYSFRSRSCMSITRDAYFCNSTDEEFYSEIPASKSNNVRKRKRTKMNSKSIKVSKTCDDVCIEVKETKTTAPVGFEPIQLPKRNEELPKLKTRNLTRKQNFRPVTSVQSISSQRSSARIASSSLPYVYYGDDYESDWTE